MMLEPTCDGARTGVGMDPEHTSTDGEDDAPATMIEVDVAAVAVPADVDRLANINEQGLACVG